MRYFKNIHPSGTDRNPDGPAAGSVPAKAAVAQPGPPFPRKPLARHAGRGRGREEGAGPGGRGRGVSPRRVRRQRDAGSNPPRGRGRGGPSGVSGSVFFMRLLNFCLQQRP